MNVLINSMKMPKNRDPATGRFLNGHNRYEFLNDPTTAQWKPIEEQKGETWKDIPGFEGRYKISNHGRIRNRNGIIKQQQKRNGYLSVGLRDGSGRKYYSVHRLVAKIFVKNENPDLFNQVNHKDENKRNNKAENLEWCDGMYNTHYGTAIERMRESRWGKRSSYYHPDRRKDRQQ